ncbi:hypothetical protein V1387_08665 [Allomuricauda taeanensis]|uniref:hypothetical protein n=1 Tax=Flagellimonas taeanensis TaxID=1005926 RepID=UPI002E7BF47E|nr:hypothetical protein [Allomuricauda taeanensis]MEE1962753.1 hypothetical protein [Allomuricauda taeanensis]
MERKAAAYDVKNSDVYMDEYDYYEVAFHIPKGMILAAYDKDGKIMRTAEKVQGHLYGPLCGRPKSC